MKEALRQILIGAGSIFLAPAGGIPQAPLRITLPPSNSTSALAYDFHAVSRDFVRAIERVEHAGQMELELKA